jgi:uncharacterized protein
MENKIENKSLDFLKQIFSLAALWVVSLSFGSLLVGLLSNTVFGIPDLQKFIDELKTGQHSDYKNIFRFLLCISHAFTFLVPAFLFTWLYWRTPFYKTLYLNKSPKINNLGISLLFILVSLPLVNFLYALNILIPASWQQSQSEDLVKILMKMDSPIALLLNLMLIGILAGVGEELIFRGILQRICAVRFQNIHIAIWLTAIIFSLIHFEIQAFLPRVALGAVLGYVFAWSGSLWTSIILHVLYNGSQVVALYAAGNLINQEKPTFELWLVVAAAISAILIFLVGRWLLRSNKEQHLQRYFFENPYFIDKTV